MRSAAFVLLLGVFATTRAPAQTPAIQKRAFVVGVSHYLKEGLTDLAYAETDAREMAAELTKQGFKVDLTIGPEATKAHIEQRLGEFFTDLGLLNKADIVVVMLTGHGMQFSVVRDDVQIEAPFFCPADARKTDPDTLLPINWIMERLAADSGSSQNLLMIDACRNNPAKGAKGVDGSTARELPSKISVLFSSSAGRESYESDRVKHGVFTYVLLDGLRGSAANRRGEVTWLSLADYAMTVVPEQSPQLTGDATLRQMPNLVGNLVTQPVLARMAAPAARVDPPGGNAGRLSDRPLPGLGPASLGPAGGASDAPVAAAVERRDNSLGMVFVKITPGELSMALANDARLGAASGATEEFWIGKYEVTQAQWTKLVGENPSYFSASGRGKNKVAGRDTSNYPVENISWDEAAGFCDMLTLDERARLPSGWAYRLPTAAQWEYAARIEARAAAAGAKTRAGWFVESSDYRTHEVGTIPGATTPLVDMLGNVGEMCLDWPVREARPGSPNGLRIVRGGSCMETAVMIGEDETAVPRRRVRNCYGFRIVLAKQQPQPTTP